VDGPQDGSGAPGLDYYINGGRIDGLRRSMLLDVYRAKTVTDDSHEHEVTIRILVGQLQVLRVYRHTAIGRIHTVHPSVVSPILRYRTVMVGDYLIPRQGDAPRAGNISLPSSVLFAFDSAVLKPSAHQAITAAYDLLHQSPDHVLVIAGHTCDRGSERYNLTLSQRRAHSVAHFLATTLKVPPDRLVIRGYGESAPLTPNRTEAERSVNRRVDFRLMPRSTALPTLVSSPRLLPPPLAARPGLRQ
jgi:outer membrane protein OmpA-like peptidoglycan-associated protein